MTHQTTFKENWQDFLARCDQLSKNLDHPQNQLIARCIEQHLLLMNDIFSAGIDYLNHLEKVKELNDVICLYAKFSHDISTKLTLSTQRFLTASLGHVTDYHEWLKTHCDFATD